MKSKKVFGYIFIILAVALSFAFIGSLPIVFKMPIMIFKLITGKLNAEDSGFVIGQLMFLIAYITALYFLWKYGLKWIKVDRENPKA